ncbi:hypothetical protein ACVJGD_008662 [Bradyrhizobium sp. USDA 10063]
MELCDSGRGLVRIKDDGMASRDLVRTDAERGRASDRTAQSERHAPGAQNIRQAGPQADADQQRWLPPRPRACARPAHRGRCERRSYHGAQKRAPTHARRRIKRTNGRFWIAQFCTEVARPPRFKRPTSTFGGERSIQLSYGRISYCRLLRATRAGQWIRLTPGTFVLRERSPLGPLHSYACLSDRFRNYPSH